MVGKWIALPLAAMLLLSSAAVHGERFKWLDAPEYTDSFFLGKVSELPGFSDHHRRLQRILKKDPSGAKLREGLTLIRGKEDGISARIFASWLAQLNAPDVKIQEFRALTKIPSNVAPSAPVVRRREFSSLAVSYFVDVIVRQSVFNSELRLRQKLTATAKRQHDEVVRLGRKIRNENRTTSLGRPASFGTGMMVHWAAHFGSGSDPSAARSILLEPKAPGYLRLLGFRGLNDIVDTKSASGTISRSTGTQGSELFAPIWPRYRNNIGVALEIARLGQTHPKLAWEATQILGKIEDPPHRLLILFNYALDVSSPSLIRAGFPGARRTIEEARSRLARANGVLAVRAD